MIINTNQVPVQRDFAGLEGASPAIQHQYTSDGQYPCQTYPEEAYQYPPHLYTPGATTAEFCDTWTNNHRFFVNGGDVNYHAASSAGMSPPRVDPYYSHNPTESADTFYVNGHHHHHHHHHHQQHQKPPNHYYGPMASSHSPDVNSHGFGSQEMSSCERDAGLMMTEKGQQNQSGETAREASAAHENSMPDPTRIGATERERTRMHMLNDAFDDLRKVRLSVHA